MVSATGGLTSGVVRTFDRLGRSATQALDIEAVTSPGPVFGNVPLSRPWSTIALVSTRLAACSCEQLRLTVEGEPVRVSICHCLACQRRTGSVFGVQARFDAEQVTTEGASRQYIRVSDEGEQRATFHFCPDCGPGKDRPPRRGDTVDARLRECSRMTPEGIYAQGRRAQFGGRSRRNRSTVAYACLQSEVSSATLAP